MSSMIMTMRQAPPTYGDLAVVALRAQLATFLQALSALPGSPLSAVLRGRAEELDAAVAATTADPVEVERRWRRLSEAIALVGPAASDLSGVTASMGSLRAVAAVA